MALRVVRRPWGSQPRGPAAIDSADLGRGAQLLFNPAQGAVELVNRNLWGYAGNAAPSPTANGIAYALDGVGDSLFLAGNQQLTSNVGTLAIWFDSVGAASAFGHVYLGSSSPAAVAFQITNTGTSQVFGGGTNTGGTALSGWFGSSRRSLVFVSGGTAGTCKLFVDGVDSGHTYSGAPIGWGSGSKTIYLGRYSAGASWDTAAKINCALLTSAVWGQREAALFHRNPWQVFAPRRIWIPTAGITALPTLSASTFKPGTLTRTGWTARITAS